MLATVKRKPKKKSINKAPGDGDPLESKAANNSSSSGNNKVKKTVKVKGDLKKKKPKVESPTTNGLSSKNGSIQVTEPKKLEPKEPADARVIDATYEESTPAPEPPKPKKVEKRDERFNYLVGKGTQHPVHELIQNLRSILLNSGFNELENSFFVADTDIKKQHNVNPNLVFDKVYYLAESQKPNVAIEQVQIDKLKEMIPSINIDKLKDILNDYKDDKLENYQIFQRLTKELSISAEEITKLLELIPGLNETNPKLTNITLRSTMASSWFTTLAAIVDKEHLPIKVYSTGIWFKRGPKLNELKLSSHYGASSIIMDEKISVTNGKIIAEEILHRLGFKDLELKKTSRSQNFNVTTDELKFFVNGIDIATCGMFDQDVLAQYSINIPTLYINFGLEHMVMVQKGFDDIRELMYPQFYKAWKLNDGQIAEALQFIQKPKTELGKRIADELVKVCEKNGNTASPCEFVVWEGPLNGTDDALKDVTNTPTPDESNNKKRLRVKVVKHEKDARLCGPAFLNEILVKDGDIYGVPANDENQEFSEAEHTNIRYLDAFSKLVGSTIEDNVEVEAKPNAADKQKKISIGIIKDMEDINLQLDGGAYRYLSTNNKKIEVRGPMFINIEWGMVNNITKEKPVV
jgi:O-phosphoseryl-tRNA synthetase